MEEEKNENLDSPNEENENDNSTNDNKPDAGEVDYEAKANELEEKNKSLYARAKKAEEEAKNLKANPPKQENETNTEYVGRIEKLELASLGETDEDIIKLAKEVAKIEKIDLSEVKNSDYFQFKKTKIEEQKQIDAASISPEDGSQPNQVQKNYKETPIEDFNKDNDLSTEEGRANFAKLKKDKGVADKFSD